jgi:hypothetical protein
MNFNCVTYLPTAVVSGISSVHGQCEAGISKSAYRVFKISTPISVTGFADSSQHMPMGCYKMSNRSNRHISYRTVHVHYLCLIPQYARHTHPCSTHAPVLDTRTHARHTHSCSTHAPVFDTRTYARHTRPCSTHAPMLDTRTLARHTYLYWGTLPTHPLGRATDPFMIQ